MDVKFVSKTNIGAVATLALVVILSQSRFFDFLIDTALGRAILVGLIIFIGYAHKILGVVAVLLIIIAFNQSNLGIFEGFDSKTSTGTTGATSTTGATGTTGTTGATNTTNTTGTTSTTGTTGTTDKKKMEISAGLTTSLSSAAAVPVTANTTSTGETFVGGREGFNITEREGAMLRGKRSNDVPVFSTARSQPDTVEPSDRSSLMGGIYSLA
jgi:hypothetical protein